MPLMNRDAEVINQIQAYWIQQHIRSITHHDQLGFIPGKQGFFNIHQSINQCGTHIIRNWRIGTIWSFQWMQKHLWKKSIPIYEKNSPESGPRGNLPQQDKGHTGQTHSQHHSQQKRMFILTTLLNIVLEVRATVIREEKDVKGIQIGKEENCHCLQMTWCYT